MLNDNIKTFIKEKIETFLNGAKRGLVYTMLLLNVGNITNFDEAQKEKKSKDDKAKTDIQTTTPEKEVVTEYIEIQEVNTTTSPIARKTPPKVQIDTTKNNYELNYSEKIKSSTEEIIEARATEFYEKLSQGRDYIPLKNLLDSTKIDIKDVCYVLSRNQDNLCQIIPGKINKQLAFSASKVIGGRGSECLFGVQIIFDNANLSGIISGNDKDWPEKIKGCSSNSACNAYIPLEKSGKFIIIEIENLAYDKSRKSDENKKMQELAQSLPIGSIIITDNKIADEHQGRVYRDLTKVYGRGGGIHGHICVKDIDGVYKSDIVEAKGPNFSKYGEIVRIALGKDINIKKELAIEIIKAYQIREFNKFVKDNQDNKINLILQNKFLSRD